MVLYETEDVLVVDKRSGWLSIPGRFGELKETAKCELSYWRKETKLDLMVVHRLDREVSGLLLFAKTPKAHRIMNDWFEKRIIKKKYEAFAVKLAGALDFEPNKPVVWKSLLLKGKKRAYEKPIGKPSITEAQLEQQLDYHGVKVEAWSVHPVTGRSHQIRFEFAKHHRPIWGDTLYGSVNHFPIPESIGLRAVAIDLSQVPAGQRLGLEAKIEIPGLAAYLRPQC